MKRDINAIFHDIITLKKQYQGVDDKIDKANPLYQARLDDLLMELMNVSKTWYEKAVKVNSA